MLYGNEDAICAKLIKITARRFRSRNEFRTTLFIFFKFFRNHHIKKTIGITHKSVNPMRDSTGKHFVHSPSTREYVLEQIAHNGPSVP